VPEPVSLRERIQEDTTAAMRSGDVLRRDVLRMASNAAYNLEKQQLRELTEDELIGVLTREVKQRRESIEAYRAGGRDDLASREEAELAILTEYLPEPLTEDQLNQLVAEGIAATGSATPRDLGKVMGWLAPRTRGRADGKVVSQKVAAALAPAEQGG
jgi:uncharacterized protein YqeY